MFCLKFLIIAFIAFKKNYALKCTQCTEEKSIDGRWSKTHIDKALAKIGTIDTNTG